MVPKFSPSANDNALLHRQIAQAQQSDPVELFLRWFWRKVIPSLNVGEPIDLADFGTGTGDLAMNAICMLEEAGHTVRSATLVEPDDAAFGQLAQTVLRNRHFHPGVRFQVAQESLEEFALTRPTTPRFNLIMINDVFPYVTDAALGFRRITSELLASNGKTIISCTTAEGIPSLNIDLCQAHGWPENCYFMHMGFLEGFASSSELTYDLETLDMHGLDITPCFDNGQYIGRLLLSCLVDRDLRLAGSEQLKLVQSVLRKHCRTSQSDPPCYILPMTKGFMLVHGKPA